jgi:hypothetical protein
MRSFVGVFWLPARLLPIRDEPAGSSCVQNSQKGDRRIGGPNKDHAMTTIVFNWLGAGFFLVAGFGAALANWLLKDGDAIPGLVDGLLALLLDGSYRGVVHHKSSLWRFIRTDQGGHLWFVPVWACGAIALAIGLAELTNQLRNNQLMKDIIRTTNDVREQLRELPNQINNPAEVARIADQIRQLSQ